MSLFVAFGVVALLVVLLYDRIPRGRSQAGDLKLRRVADDVYLYRGYFSNSAVLVLSDGVLIVDTQVAPLAGKRLRDEIEKVTSKPIRWVVNTHYHGDHTGGNALFPEAEIIATTDCARYIVERDAERVDYANTFGLAFQEVHPTIGPTRTFEGSLRIGEIEIHQIGRCETPDACVVYWPRRGVVACGDGVATEEYPFNGVPFLDEGLRDDGEWVRFLQTIRGWRPHILLPGHGEPLVGEETIASRLELLSELFTDVLRATRQEMARGTPFGELVEIVDEKLSRYREHPGLHEGTVSQRFLIYRAYNNLSPERKGKGWWDDLRPSVIRRAACDEPYSRARATSLDRPRAITMLETHLDTEPGDSAAWALLSDIFLDGARSVRPKVDATEYFVASTKAARKALAIDPDAQLALLNLGCAEVFGGMVLAQSMSPAIDKLERAIARGGLTAQQRLKAEFFLGKAHQMELRDHESDKHLRRLLPLVLRPLYPLIRPTLRAMP